MISSNSFYGKRFCVVPGDGYQSEDEILESEDEQDMEMDCREHLEVPETDESEYDSDDEKPLSALRSKDKKKQKVTWRNKSRASFMDSDYPFLGTKELPEEMSSLETPADFFSFLFTGELFDMIVEESNRKALQDNINKPVNITRSEMEQFVGISLFTSFIKLPSTRRYWNSQLGQPFVYETMPCRRWEEIQRCLHFADNDKFERFGQPGHDKLFKVRPLLNNIRERLLLIPKEEHLAVDEQIIPTKCRHHLKQYNPKKPHKWGFCYFEKCVTAQPAIYGKGNFA